MGRVCWLVCFNLQSATARVRASAMCVLVFLGCLGLNERWDVFSVCIQTHVHRYVTYYILILTRVRPPELEGILLRDVAPVAHEVDLELLHARALLVHLWSFCFLFFNVGVGVCAVERVCASGREGFPTLSPIINNNPITHRPVVQRVHLLLGQRRRPPRLGHGRLGGGVGRGCCFLGV